MDERLKIIYACDFSLNKSTGKNRATRQKLDALKRRQGVRLTYYSADEGLLAPLKLLINEFRIIASILKLKPDAIITRGSAGS
ncbi:hypothetical protein PSH49_21965, partial [Pseudoalteromonas sp. GABNS16G]